MRRHVRHCWPVHRTAQDGLLFGMALFAGLHVMAEPIEAQFRRRGANAEVRLPSPSTLLRTGRTTVSAGTEAGAGAIGFPHAMTQDGRGNLYVLDGGAFAIRMFDARGRFVTMTGQKGRGPGDLFVPGSIAHDGDSTLYVADEMNGLSVFITTGDRITHARTLFTNERPGGVCMSRGRIIVGMVIGDHSLHEVTGDGRIVRSFGPVFGADSVPGIRAWGRAGGTRPFCDPDDGGVTTWHPGGDVLRFDSTGTHRWTTRVPGYLGPTIHASSTGGMSMPFGKQERVPITTIGPYVVAQALDVRREGRRLPGGGSRLIREVHGVTTWVLVKETGAVLAHGSWGPALVDIRDGRALAYEEEPFPRVWMIPVETRR